MRAVLPAAQSRKATLAFAGAHRVCAAPLSHRGWDARDRKGRFADNAEPVVTQRAIPDDDPEDDCANEREDKDDTDDPQLDFAEEKSFH
ncbi:hypothetical protein [Albidovulum aquaemixtae]|uniref:hypothetical protein n=1 Tax=Albidovulum aquaemixtae TaxID=1542388 RepID=UPI0015E825F9|nr:hypothetical protein [Defluviimonas aquaemixtae]